MKIALRILLILTLLTSYKCYGEISKETAFKWPTIGISVLVRNKAHTLPYFLTCLHNLDYPKDRLYLWIYSDFNEDKSVEILETWAEKYASKYSGVYITTNITSGHLHADEKNSLHWSPKHFKHVIRLREEALAFARRMWVDYIFMLDADVFLTTSSSLKALVSKGYTVVSPMLVSDGLYSNFWCGMTENYYYQRTDDYTPILNRDKIGCFNVPMVHTAVLISLRRIISDHFTYNPEKVKNYKGPVDDIITFAISARSKGVSLYVCNDNHYGFVPVPLEENNDPQNDSEQMLNIKIEAIGRGDPIPLNVSLEKYVTYPEPWKFGCSEIYMINLERRKERRRLMELSFQELGMKVKLFKAVDGRTINLSDLRKFYVTLMPIYEDPYHRRPMKAGEIGCFLSHYYIWREIAANSHALTLVLEDDIHFVPYFRNRFLQLMDEIKGLDWDLVYIGRKILQHGEEEHVTPHTTRPLYSYWTLGYLITERGARKLLNAEPLAKMLPVDEFLPIMFNQHPNDTWKSYFSNRNLQAFSAAPLLVHPTHYTGQPGYISDTEDSVIVVLKHPPEHRIKHEL